MSKTTPLYVIRDGADAEAAWLTAHGFDGICDPVGECGCFIGDLYPCGERGDKRTCVAGHESNGGIYTDVSRSSAAEHGSSRKKSTTI